MCGLIGIINKKWDKTLSVQTESLFKQLIYVGALRGFDSTGIFKVTEKHEVEAVKKASAAGWFLGLKESQELINNYYKDSIAVFAHNRKATMGLKDDATAHPFKEGPITLIHNGTLTNWDRRNNTLSDSHYICKSLAEENKEFKPLESFQGAYALIWHNSAKKQINFCRNDERPLWIIEAKDWYILASEREMAEWILLRNGHDVLDAIEVEAGYIYKMSWKNKLHITKIKFTPAKKAVFPNNINNNSFKQTKYDSDDYDFEESGFGNFAATEASKRRDRGPVDHDKFRTPWTPPVSSNNASYPQSGVTQMIIVPYQAIKGDFTFNGYAKWAGVGVKEERMEITARIHFPLSLAGQKAIWNVAMNDWDSSILNEHCECIYQYRAGAVADGYIAVRDVKKKLASPLSSPILLTAPKSPASLDTTPVEDEVNKALAEATRQDLYLDSETIVETYNNYCITADNWEDVASLKCKCCKTEFDYDLAEQSFISERLKGGEITYTFICPACFETIRNKEPKKTNNIITLDQARMSIRPAN